MLWPTKDGTAACNRETAWNTDQRDHTYMPKPVNTLASIATYATLIAVLQASSPNLKAIFVEGTATKGQIFDVIYTICLTVFTIAAKHQENPVEYTPKWMIGMNRSDIEDMPPSTKKDNKDE